MTMQEVFVPSDKLGSDARTLDHPSSLARRWSAFRAWLKRCADNYAAAAAYEHLSNLSDGELHQRGLSRDILARDLSQDVTEIEATDQTRTR
jgi:hypothetical protein